MYSIMTIVNTAVWHIWKFLREWTLKFSSQRKKYYFFFLFCIYMRCWILTKLIFISWYMWVVMWRDFNSYGGICQLCLNKIGGKSLRWHSCVQSVHCSFGSEIQTCVQAIEYKWCNTSDPHMSWMFSDWRFKTGVFVFKTAIEQHKE